MSPSELLKTAAKELRDLRAQNSVLKEKVEKHEKLDEAEKIAMKMVDKGMLPREDVKAKADQLIEEGKDLEVIDEAIKIAEDSTNPIFAGIMSSETSGTSEDKLVNWLMGMNS